MIKEALRLAKELMASLRGWAVGMKSRGYRKGEVASLADEVEVVFSMFQRARSIEGTESQELAKSYLHELKWEKEVLLKSQ